MIPYDGVRRNRQIDLSGIPCTSACAWAVCVCARSLSRALCLSVSFALSRSRSCSHFRSAHGPARRNPWAICPLFSSEARWHRSCTSACQSASAIAWPARVDARPSEDSTREIIEPHCSYLGKDETVSPVRCDETTDETGAGFESNRFKLPARVLWTRLISKAAKEVLPAEADSIFRSCSPFFGLPKNGKSRPFTNYNLGY